MKWSICLRPAVLAACAIRSASRVPGFPLSIRTDSPAGVTINVAAPIEGTVGAFFADVGQEVFEGQLLARITNGGLETGNGGLQDLREPLVEQ